MTMTARSTWLKRLLFASTGQRTGIKGLMRFRHTSTALRLTWRSASCANESAGSWFRLLVSFSQTTAENHSSSIHQTNARYKIPNWWTRNEEQQCSAQLEHCLRSIERH